MNPLFGWELCVVQQVTFILTKTMNKLVSTKNCVFISFVGPSETGKSQLDYNWLKNGIFNLNLTHFPNQQSQTLYDVLQKEVEILEFVQGVTFEFKDSLKNNGAKYLYL